MKARHMIFFIKGSKFKINEMKNIAKLALFFSLSFIIIFVAALIIRVSASWVEMARLIPVAARSGEDIGQLAWRSLPTSIYLAILITLSYSARRNIAIPNSIICIVILASIFTGSLALGIDRVEAVKPALNPANPVQAGPGLILSRSNSAIVLLKHSSDVRGPRIVSFPDQALIYQELPLGPNNTIIPLPPLPLGEEAPWFTRSIEIDLNLSGRELKNRYEENPIDFAIYAFSLILLLASFRFILEFSQWPLANLFLGALIFRGILAFEVFVNAPEITTLIGAFLSDRAPLPLISPLAFITPGILIILYTLLARIDRPRRKQDG